MSPRLIIACLLTALVGAALLGCTRATDTEVAEAPPPQDLSAPPEDVAAPAAERPTADEAGSADLEEAKVLLEAKCTTCHDLQRVQEESEDEGKWRETVVRMQGKKPGHISDDEAETIIKYLAATYGE